MLARLAAAAPVFIMAENRAFKAKFRVPTARNNVSFFFSVLSGRPTKIFERLRGRTYLPLGVKDVKKIYDKDISC